MTVEHGTGPAQLAQVNLARLRYDPDDVRLAEFLAAVDAMNALAERSPGFRWRLRSTGGHLNGAAVLGDPRAVVNVSVWESYPRLHDYVYRSRHGGLVTRRARWFDRLPAPTTALWWVPYGQRPTPAQALARLDHLRVHGPTARAFTVRCRFTPDGRRESRGRLSSVD